MIMIKFSLIVMLIISTIWAEQKLTPWRFAIVTFFASILVIWGEDIMSGTHIPEIFKVPGIKELAFGLITSGCTSLIIWLQQRSKSN